MTSGWTPPRAIPVLLLAAGASTRFGADKLLADVAGPHLTSARQAGDAANGGRS